MIISKLSFFTVFGLLVLILEKSNVIAKKPSRSATLSRVRPSKSGSKSRRKPTGSRGAPPESRRRQQYEDDENDESQEDESYDEEDSDLAPRSRRTTMRTGRTPQSRRTRQKRPTSTRGPPQRSQSRKRVDYDDYNEDYYESKRELSSRGHRTREQYGTRRPGQVVPSYRNQPAAFTRGLAALRSSLPDPGAVKEAAFSSISAARETTSRLSSNLYRDIKGLTSSELEQVMLKATRPDDTPVKGKHVERLVGVTYQVSARYEIYDSVLRKLWSKMAEKDWRTKIKALYLLHRYSADGAPEHQNNLKASLRKFRHTRDEKRKCKYFNSKRLMAGDTDPECSTFRAFIKRYGDYVLLRAQTFGGIFEEISTVPRKSKKPPKPITSSALSEVNLKSAQLVLELGIKCMLKEGEECENTAMAVERVAGDLIGLSTAVAVSLNRVLKNSDLLKESNKLLLKRWCEFYSEELLPRTRSMVKKTSSKLDAFGLYLPSRMGTTISQEILQKGLKLEEEGEGGDSPDSDENDEDVAIESPAENEAIGKDEIVDEQDEEESEDEEKAEDEEKSRKEDSAKDDEVEELYDDYEDSEFDYDEEYYDDDEE